MAILDTRTRNIALELAATTASVNHEVSSRFQEDGSSGSKTTKLIHASVHPNGYYISSGQMKESFLNIWDLRYSQVQRGPTQKLQLHSNF